MNIYHSLEEYRQKNQDRRHTSVTPGKFDGLHLGHMKLIRRVLEQASSLDLQSVVLTIETSGSGILSHEERAQILEESGIDTLIECPFTTSFREMSPAQFASLVLDQTLHTAYAAVGSDFRFGQNRAGDAQMLALYADAFGARTQIFPKETYLSEEISSTRVREALRSADLELVSALLGRDYCVKGTVCHGRRLGASIGIPTANLLPPPDKILPPDGVYASRVLLPDHSVKSAVTNIGLRPTVHGTHRTIETHIPGYEGDLYTKQLTVSILRRLRPEIRFDSLEDLKAQMRKDIEECRSDT